MAILGWQTREPLVGLTENHNNCKDTGAAHRTKGRTQRPGLEQDRMQRALRVSTARALNLSPGEAAFSAAAPATEVEQNAFTR